MATESPNARPRYQQRPQPSTNLRIEKLPRGARDGIPQGMPASASPRERHRGAIWWPKGPERSRCYAKLFACYAPCAPGPQPSGPPASTRQRRDVAPPAKLERAAKGAAAARTAPVLRKPPRACRDKCMCLLDARHMNLKKFMQWGHCMHPALLPD